VNLQALVKKPPSWLSGEDDAGGIVVSCRARLARNLADYPFGTKITDEQRDLVVQQVLAAAKGSQLMETATFLDMSTLDGNEQFRDIVTFREHWETYRAEPGLAVLFEGDRLLFVEQPLHRDVALAESVRDELVAWGEAPSMIIDESDGELDSMRRAIALGYRGTSHKNCKGVIKGLANRCLIEWYRRQRPEEGPWLMSGEDLANVGPVALLNDLAAMAVFGIGDVERNGHHYFAGLSMFPEELQKMVCERHPDLYEMRPEGYASLRIEGGQVSTRSAGEAPFGHGLDLTPETLAFLGDEGLPATT
jgi:hypothetical protein